MGGYAPFKGMQRLASLEKIKRHVYGDHDLFIFEVTKWKSLNDQHLLTFNRLKELGLIL